MILRAIFCKFFFTFAIVILNGLFISLINPGCNAISYAKVPDRAKDQETFNLLLDSIKTLSTEEQFTALESFVEDHLGFERGYFTLLDRYIFQEKVQVAKTFFMNLAENSKYPHNSYWMLAKIYLSENNPDAAWGAFTRALNTGSPPVGLIKDIVKFDHQQSGSYDSQKIVTSLKLDLGVIKLGLGFRSYYESNCDRAIASFTGIPDQFSNDYVVLDLWGDCSQYISRYDEADSLWRMGLKISKKEGNLRAQAKFLSNLGFLQYKLRNYEFALSYYDSAYFIAKNEKDIHLLHFLAGSRGFINRDRGNYAEAERLFKEAINIAKKIGKMRSLAEWYSGYAMTLYYLGRYQEALKTLDKSEGYGRESNYYGHLISIKLSQSVIYIALNQYDLAKQTLYDAVELARNHKLNNYEMFAKAKLGEILLFEGQYDKARKNFQEYIDFLVKIGNSRKRTYWLGCIGDSYKLENKYDLAREVYQRAFEAAEDAEANTFSGQYSTRIADMEVHLENYDSALQMYQVASKIVSKENITELLWKIYCGIGNVYRKTGKVDSAISAYAKAVEIIESTRKGLEVDQFRLGYFSGGIEVYESLVESFLKRYEINGNHSDIDSLFFYEEMGRGRALKSLKFESVATHQNNEYLRAKRELQRLQRRLRLGREKYRPADELDEILVQLDAARISLLAQQLRTTEEQTARDVSDLEKPSLEKLIEDLQQRQFGLLLYHISEDNSFILACNGKDVKIVKLAESADEIGVLVDSLVTPLHNVTEEMLQQTLFRADVAHRLYQLLVKPVEAVISLPENLLILPDVELNKLPFGMLLTESPDASVYTPSEYPSYKNSFLLHRYVFAYSPSTLFLDRSSKSISGNSDVAVFADPVGLSSVSTEDHIRLRTGWIFEPLVFAEREAQAIKEIQPQIKVFSKEMATKRIFVEEAPQHHVVHFATHAFVDTSFDAFSGLVLSAEDDSTDDGMLMGYEIADMKLQCDLISLSACETGRGKSVAGEGVLGLPRLFLGAGAKTVLMTLWKVDDKFASELMPEFYDHFLNQNFSKAGALNEAKRRMLSQIPAENLENYYQHPFYWASFALYGDPGIKLEAKSEIPKFVMIFVVIMAIAFIAVFMIHRSYTRKKISC